MANKKELFRRCENNVMNLNSSIQQMYSDFMRCVPSTIKSKNTGREEEFIKKCSQDELVMFSRVAKKFEYWIDRMYFKFREIDGDVDVDE